VPVLILQGFTPSGARDDFLWVHDRKQREPWRVKPDQAAHERDYYRVEIPNVDPNIVETALGETIEAQAAALIQKMNRDQELPRGEGFQILVEFVTFLALRTPSVRRLYERSVELLYRQSAKACLATPDLFHHFIAEQQKSGVEIPPEITYENLRDFALDDNRNVVETPRTKSVQAILLAWKDLTPIFLERQWSLFFARPEDGRLFCSDMPVSITPTSPRLKQQPLGFGLRQTELTVPLSRSMALVGSYESPSVTGEISLDFVRDLNRRTLAFTERFIFSSEKSLLV
jgi:hypothetical protein